MKKVIVVILIAMFLVTIAEARMVDSQTNARTIKRIQRISQILDNTRNQIGIEYAAIQADIQAHPSRLHPDDRASLQSLAALLTTIKDNIAAYEAQKNIVFPDME